MSGEGLIAGGQPIGAGRSAVARDGERADVLAYLRRRQDNAVIFAEAAKRGGHGAEMEALAIDRRRQLEVLIDEIASGLHVGEVQAQRDMASARTAQPTDEVYTQLGEQ